MRHTIPDEYCPGELIPSEGRIEMAWFMCLREVDHDGDHRTICNFPCRACGGIDHHYDDCEDVGETVGYEEDLMIIYFDDEGAYWGGGRTRT